jgi:integrase/recombinase XerD
VSLGQLEPNLKPLFVDEIDKQTISDIIRDRRAQGVTTATIRRDLTALSQFLEYAIDEGWRGDDESNPALRRMKKLKERREPIVLPLTEDIDYVIGRAPGNFGRLIEAAGTPAAGRTSSPRPSGGCSTATGAS